MAWDTFTSYLAAHNAAVISSREIDLEAVFGDDWANRALDVERYLVKHIICRLVDEAPAPVSIAGDYIDILNGGPRPESLEIDLVMDLGVVEMLRATREAPSPEGPEAAQSGFLGTPALSANQSRSTDR
jgi:hypothetical protein